VRDLKVETAEGSETAALSPLGERSDLFLIQGHPSNFSGRL